jgi:hypothetical protein
LIRVREPYLQASSYGKALVLLPLVLSGNFHHKSFVYNIEREP